MAQLSFITLHLRGRQVLLSSCWMLRLRKMAFFKGTLHPNFVDQRLRLSTWIQPLGLVLIKPLGRVLILLRASLIPSRASIRVPLSDPLLHVDAVGEIVDAVDSMAARSIARD